MASCVVLGGGSCSRVLCRERSKELTIRQGGPLIISSKLCRVYKSGIRMVSTDCRRPSLCKCFHSQISVCTLSFLGHYFLYFESSSGSKKLWYIQVCYIFNLLHEIFSYKFLFSRLWRWFYLLLDHLNRSSVIRGGAYWYIKAM
jgi:hypothetical protein